MSSRILAILADARVAPRNAASAPLDDALPPDLRALFALSDGLDLADGTRLLQEHEIAPATAWLVAEKSLGWPEDLWVIGERDDLVIVRDLDRDQTRAGGGVLEAPTDGLSHFSREALDVVGYLEERLRLTTMAELRAPERAARDGAARRDEKALIEALARDFHPDARRELAHAALTLGSLYAERGAVEDAMAAFARAVDARVKSAARGAGEAEARAAWRACAVAAEKAGAPTLASACRATSNGSSSR